ncbi:MAG: DMT family transporter [Chloroflexi bacterium]|nr:DMT family transporter [Chloroflexota bacterium]
MLTIKNFRSEAMLLLTALIWGFAFVAQRVGMEHMGPFTFNGLRFALGSLTLIPVLWWRHKKNDQSKTVIARKSVIAGTLAGAILFLGASLQQIGLMTTTAGKAGFITGFYVILVPVLGLFWGQHAGRSTWVGAIVALIGLFYLSVRRDLYMVQGDIFMILGAFCWAGHVQIIDYFSARVGAVRLAFMQFVTTSVLSFFVGWLIEDWNSMAWGGAWIAVLFAGIFSVGIAYTLQVIAQKDAPPARAAIILSLESVFAVLGGWLFLREMLSPRGIFGAVLMLTGTWISLSSRKQT